MAVSVSSTEAQEGRGRATSSFWALTLGSIGVVFGDIGTSPLYAFREAVGGAAHGQPVTRIMVLGVLSLILWALFTVVTAKYVLLLLRADNNGEGGIFALYSLIRKYGAWLAIPAMLGGAALMMTLAMGIRQNLGLFQAPASRELGIAISTSRWRSPCSRSPGA